VQWVVTGATVGQKEDEADKLDQVMVHSGFKPG